MTPREARFVVFTNAIPGRDEAFNQWYDDVHLAEVCAVPGVTSARRFDTVAVGDAAPAHRYLAIYDIIADDPAAVVVEIQRRYHAGEMEATDALADDTLTILAQTRSVEA